MWRVVRSDRNLQVIPGSSDHLASTVQVPVSASGVSRSIAIRRRSTVSLTMTTTPSSTPSWPSSAMIYGNRLAQREGSYRTLPPDAMALGRSVPPW